MIEREGDTRDPRQGDVAIGLEGRLTGDVAIAIRDGLLDEGTMAFAEGGANRAEGEVAGEIFQAVLHFADGAALIQTTRLGELNRTTDAAKARNHDRTIVDADFGAIGSIGEGDGDRRGVDAGGNLLLDWCAHAVEAHRDAGLHGGTTRTFNGDMATALDGVGPGAIGTATH